MDASTYVRTLRSGTGSNHILGGYLFSAGDAIQFNSRVKYIRFLIMVRKMASKNENGNGNGSNGKERVEFFASRDLQEKIESAAIAEDRSVNSLLRDSVERYLDRKSVKELIKESCSKGKLREESSACRYATRDTD